MTQTAETIDRHAAIDAAIESLGLSIKATFIPFSQSRNKHEKSPSLNWRVTLGRQVNRVDGAPIYQSILTTDYSAGCGHCPSYKQSFGQPTIADRERFDAVRKECETGTAHKPAVGLGFHDTRKPILPTTRDVLYSLVMDSSVLDAGGFESWASEYGYDTDSRKAEAIYRNCLDIALKLRGALGEGGLNTLREAFQDY